MSDLETARAQPTGDLELSLDIETAAQPSNDPSRKLVLVLSIAAVVFDPKEENSFSELIGEKHYKEGLGVHQQVLNTDRHFYSPISLAQSIQQGFDIDKSTIGFWEKNARDPKSYSMLAESAAFTEDIKVTLERFANFVKQNKLKRVWAKSPSFDCVIVREMFNRLALELPINWWTERDIRTLMDIGDVKVPFPQGFMLHHAMHDAAFEAMQVQRFNATKRETAEKLRKLEFYESQHVFDVAPGEKAGPDVRWPVLVNGEWEWAYPKPPKAPRPPKAPKETKPSEKKVRPPSVKADGKPVADVAMDKK